MQKSITSREYAVLLSLLRRVRNEAGLSQEQLAERLGRTQSFLSKVERGERRIDVIELRSFCAAMGLPLADFVSRLEGELGGGAGR